MDRPNRFVRQFALTRGRVAGARDLPLDALVQATEAGRAAIPRLAPQHRAVIELTSSPISIAEVAARSGLHLGIARVLVGDLAASDHVMVADDSSNTDGPDLPSLERLLDDLQAY